MTVILLAFLVTFHVRLVSRASSFCWLIIMKTLHYEEKLITDLTVATESASCRLACNLGV